MCKTTVMAYQLLLAQNLSDYLKLPIFDTVVHNYKCLLVHQAMNWKWE